MVLSGGWSDKGHASNTVPLSSSTHRASEGRRLRFRAREIVRETPRGEDVMQRLQQTADAVAIGHSVRSTTVLEPQDFASTSTTTRFAVRLFDLVVATVALVITLPLTLVIAVLVRLSSSGPVFYIGDRWGRHNTTYRMLKFRTMVEHADDTLGVILAGNPEVAAEYAEHFKVRNDPRITRVGSVLRRLSLDELPQLLNVLLGHMSIVGPRPKLLPEADRYGNALGVVLSVRPGMTGLWQVSGRNDLSYDERINLDLEYVSTRTLWRDIVICVKTGCAMLRPVSGAY
jgi:lipopolysaccharide/colanic/teichoic acid biosynthesis glycosyltransferase